MSKEISAPLARTARLLDLVPYLNTHQGIALKDLAQHFDVSTSQMSADLTTLWMCGLPGYTPLELMDLEFESGFVTIRNAETLSKPRSITFQEAIALLLGLDLIASAIPHDREDLKVVAISLRERVSRILGVPVHVQAVPIISTAIRSTIQEALDQARGLAIDYHSMYKDSLSSRIIVPVDLYESNGNQYLRAFCFTAQDFREFRVDRIIKATVSDVPDSLENQKGPKEKITFQLTARIISRDIVERFSLESTRNDSQFSLTSYSEQWIERSVLASGEGVVLDSPLEIRSRLINTAQQMLTRYDEA